MNYSRSLLAQALFCCAMCLCVAAQNGLKQLAVLKPANAGPGDNLGNWVSISGNVIVAFGSAGECVFVKPHNGWRNMKATATLTTSDGVELRFVSIQGDTIVAAGIGGAAYVFVKAPTGWADMTETAKLTTSDGSTFFSVAIDGNTIIAGAPDAEIGANQAQGAGYVFVQPAGGWTNMTETAKLTASDGAANDTFGAGVAVSGGTIVAGAPFASSGGGEGYVFVEPSGGWVSTTETAKLNASNEFEVANLGFSVAIEGSTIVAGAPGEYDSNGVGGGAAYIFEEAEGGWVSTTETAQLSPSNPVELGSMGWSVSISGNLVVAGSPGSLAYHHRQLAYEFLEPAGGWRSMTQTIAQGPSNAPAYAEFGYSVSSIAKTLVVGAPGTVYTNDQGLVYVFGPSQ
jgi:hypothetical protein